MKGSGGQALPTEFPGNHEEELLCSWVFPIGLCLPAPLLSFPLSLSLVSLRLSEWYGGRAFGHLTFSPVLNNSLLLRGP